MSAPVERALALAPFSTPNPQPALIRSSQHISHAFYAALRAWDNEPVSKSERHEDPLEIVGKKA